MFSTIVVGDESQRDADAHSLLYAGAARDRRPEDCAVHAMNIRNVGTLYTTMEQARH